MSRALGIQTVTANGVTLPKMNVGVVGPGGSGKTTIFGGFASDPRLAPVFWANAGGNPNLLISSGVIQWGMEVTDWRDILPMLDFFSLGQPARHEFRTKWEVPADVKFNGLVLDTGSFFQQLIVDDVYKSKPGSGDLVKIEATKHGSEITGTTLALARRIMVLPVHTFVSYQLYNKLDIQAKAGGGVDSISSKDAIQLYGVSRDILPSLHNLMMLLQQKEVLEFDKNLKKNVHRQVVVARFRDMSSVSKNQISPGLGEEMSDVSAEKILDTIEADWKEKLNVR